MKTLILKSSRNGFEQYFLRNMQNNMAETKAIYAETSNIILHYIMVLWMKILKFPLESLWYGTWKKKLDTYNCVIVFDYIYSWKLLDYIHKNNSNCRIIFWYWNKINLKTTPRIPEQYREFCEEWSFDEEDCKKYRLNYNIQFYFQQKEFPTIYKYDAIFIGYDKNRFDILKEIDSTFMQNGLKSKIMIVRDQTSKEQDDLYCTKGIPYEEILQLIQESRCIIEVPQKGQNGFTMRVLESIFYNRKLLITDENVRLFDFYNENNIFIWKKNCLKELKEFFSRPYLPYPETILKEHDFEYWLKNFRL